MARITHVKAAQQRYERVPVLNEDGTQKETPKIGRSGEQATTKRGKPVTMKVTAADKTKPLPMPKCEVCSKEIQVGQPYKHVTPKSGPYGGRTRNRCATCPTWQPWDLSNALWARIAQIVDGFDVDFSTIDNVDDVQSALESVASEVRSLSEEKQEGADNIESGFGHATSQSEELADIAQQLESWADDIESAEIPDLPEPEEGDCEDCEGTGYIKDSQPEKDEDDPCETCNSTGRVTPEEPTEEQMEDWRSEVESACDIVNESPV